MDAHNLFNILVFSKSFLEISHGLGVTPDMVIVQLRHGSSTSDWVSDVTGKLYDYSTCLLVWYQYWLEWFNANNFDFIMTIDALLTIKRPYVSVIIIYIFVLAYNRVLLWIEWIGFHTIYNIQRNKSNTCRLN